MSQPVSSRLTSRQRLQRYGEIRRGSRHRETALFDALVAEALDALPSPVSAYMDNVAVIVEEDVSAAQRAELGLGARDTLLGLYEGINRAERGTGYNLVAPDRITLFRHPLLDAAGTNRGELLREIRATIIHEVGHHVGLGDPEIERLERAARHRA